MHWKTWIPLVLAVFLGLVAAKAGRDLLIRAQSAGINQGRFTRLVVARQDMEPGHAIVADDLAMAVAPAENYPRNSFANEADLVGRVVIHPVVKGQAIVETLLAPTGATAGASAMIPAGFCAISVEINESSGVAGLLVPGCRVDVVSTMQDERLRQPVARRIIENARVLAVGGRVSLSSKSDRDDAARATSVTLLVRPREAEAIDLASSAGRVRLVLRNALDDQPVPSEGITVAELLGGSRAEPEPVLARQPAPATQPLSPHPVPHQIATPRTPETRVVEVIRNGKVTQVEIPIGPVSIKDSELTGGPTEVLGQE
jgi:pilus assembly protein CpaB